MDYTKKKNEKMKIIKASKEAYQARTGQEGVDRGRGVVLFPVRARSPAATEGARGVAPKSSWRV